MTLKQYSILIYQLAILLLISQNTLAQNSNDTIKLTLTEARAFALSNNKTVLASKMDVEIAKNKVRETTTIGLPQFNVDANYQHIIGDIIKFPVNPNEPPIPILERDNATIDFKITQLIFSGEYIVGLQATKVYRSISEQNLIKNQLDIIQSVEGTYNMILVFKENLKIIQENKFLTEKTLSEMQAMLDAGFIEDTEVDQIKINLTGLNNLEASFVGQLQNSINLLKFQLGMDFNQNVSIVDDINTSIDLLKPVYEKYFDVNQNIEYKMVNNKVQISKLNLRKEKSTFLPVIAGFYNHQELWKEPLLNFQPQDIIGVSLSIPIITSGQRLFKVKQASISLDKSEIEKSQLNDGLQLKYQNLLLNYETAYNKYINHKDKCSLCKKIFEKTNIKFKEGVSSSFDLTQIQIQYLTSISDYYNTILELLNTKNEIERLLSNK